MYVTTECRSMHVILICANWNCTVRKKTQKKYFACAISHTQKTPIFATNNFLTAYICMLTSYICIKHSYLHDKPTHVCIFAHTWAHITKLNIHAHKLPTHLYKSFHFSVSDRFDEITTIFGYVKFLSTPASLDEWNVCICVFSLCLLYARAVEPDFMSFVYMRNYIYIYVYKI